MSVPELEPHTGGTERPRERPQVRLLRFGTFELDLEQLELRREGRRVALQELPLRLLTVLLESPGRVISRDELRTRLWGEHTHLEVDTSLNTAVSRLRDALGDSAASPRFVATVPRRGYRFLGPVECVAEAAPGQPRRKRPPALALMVVALVALASALVGLAARHGAAGKADPPALATAAEVQTRYERGLLFASRTTRAGYERAIAEFQSAIAREPGHAGAYSGLASAYFMLGHYDYWRPRDAFGPALLMAERALELDPDSASAHLVRGMVLGVAEWRWQDGLAQVRRALELDPELPEGHRLLGSMLGFLGLHDQALEAARRALELRPLSAALESSYGWRLFAARRYDDALEHGRRALELDPVHYDAVDLIKWVLIWLRRDSEAAQAWQRLVVLEGERPEGSAAKFEREGLEGLLRSSVEAQLERQRRGYASPYDLALDLAALGEVAQAMVWLERSVAERETDLAGLAVDPRLDPLRGESRFREILEQIGLPELPGDSPAGRE